MHLTALVLRDLAVLDRALTGRDADLAETLEALGAAVRRAVPSFLGLRLSVPGPTPFVLAAEEAGPDAAGRPAHASLRLPVGPGDGAGPVAQEVVLVLRAAQAGAFVDLAADLSWLTGSALGRYVLDEDLTPTRDLSDADEAAASVAQASAVDQAVGVLLGRGLLPAEATDELDARADAAGTDRHGAAVDLLDGLGRPGSAAP